MDKEIDYAESTIDSEAKLRALAIERIDKDWNKLYDDLIEWNTTYGDGINENITMAWETATDALLKYGSVLEALNQIKTENSISGKEGLQNDAATEAQAKLLVGKMKNNSALWFTNIGEWEKRRLHLENLEYAKQLEQLLGRSVTYKNGSYYVDTDNGKKELYSIYHKGGIVGQGSSASNGNISSVKQNEIMALLEKGEIVANGQQQGNLSDYISVTSDIISMFKELLSSDFRTGEVTGGNFIPQFDITLTGDIRSEDEAMKYGSLIGQTASDYILNAAEKMGYKNTGRSLLK